jgi:uncharacterized protein (DUF488 family)
MRTIYAAQLETPEARFAFEQTRQAAAEKPTALLCFEAEAGSCHRAMVAERLAAESGFEVVDL